VVTAVARRGGRRAALYPRVDLTATALGRIADGPARRGLQALGVALFLALVAAGLLGEQSTFKNILPVAVWVLWWVGCTFLCLGVGNLWPLLNPYAALHDWGAALCRRATGESDPEHAGSSLPYPARLGALPAAVLFAGLVWMEVVWDGGEVPRTLAISMLAYGLFTWAGMALFGREPWLRNVEVFSVYFRILGRFAPLGRGADLSGSGRPGGANGHGGPQGAGLELRPLAAALLTARPIGTSLVTFDGFTETTLWTGLAVRVQGSSLGRAMGSSAGVLLVTLAWMASGVLFVLVFYLFAWATIVAAGRPTGPGVADTAGLFVLTLVPIAIAYHFAHYLSFLLIAGQYAIPLVSDPLGLGWDLFGTTLYRVDFSVIDARAIWYTALVAVVVGHVVAIHLAHITALRVYPTSRQALRSQIPMVVLMVGYTMLSLWILSQPIVRRR
jgi:hypothetical protein